MDVKQFEGSTPGPWSVRTAKEFIKPRTFEIINRDGLLITSVNIGMFDVERNAKLIAAAPDLLKENQSLRSELQQVIQEKESMHIVHCRMLETRDRELQKQKELNAELVEAAGEAMKHLRAFKEIFAGTFTDDVGSQNAYHKLKSVIKKYKSGMST